MVEKRFVLDGFQHSDGHHFMRDNLTGKCYTINSLKFQKEMVNLYNELNYDITFYKNECETFINTLQKFYDELEDNYNCSVKAGMPTGGIIAMLDLIEDIAEELNLELNGESEDE